MGVGTAILAYALAGQPVAALQPTSKWTIDYADDYCTVGRAYGSSEKPVVLGIEADVMGHGVQVAFIDSRINGKFESRAIHVQFAPEGVPITFDGGTLPVGQKGVQKLVFHLDETGILRLKDATWLAADVRKNSPVALDVAGVPAALAALEKCRVDLVISWGMNPTEQARVKVPAKLIPNLAKHGIFNTDDYPTAALRERQSGSTSVRLRIEADGRPADCTVTRSSGSVALDTTTCRVIMQRARYVPALDVEGKPMASIDTAKINWAIPQ